LLVIAGQDIPSLLSRHRALLRLKVPAVVWRTVPAVGGEHRSATPIR
jgi:hypothetical protein